MRGLFVLYYIDMQPDSCLQYKFSANETANETANEKFIIPFVISCISHH